MKKPLLSIILLFGVFTAKAQTPKANPPDLNKIEIKEFNDSTKSKAANNSLVLDGKITEDPESLINSNPKEMEPRFPGGIDAFYNYVITNIKKIPFSQYVKGKIIVRFVIDSDGHVIKPEILDGAITDVMKKELLRLFSESPTWQPGIQNSKAVRVQYTIPINF